MLKAWQLPIEGFFQVTSSFYYLLQLLGGFHIHILYFIKLLVFTKEIIGILMIIWLIVKPVNNTKMKIIINRRNHLLDA